MPCITLHSKERTNPSDGTQAHDHPEPLRETLDDMTEREQERPRQAARNGDHPYDPERPQYLYLDNGDGSLFRVGIATPADFDEHGVISGRRPTVSEMNGDHPYDPARPQYLYRDNGDGSLFCVGMATPYDFDASGVIHGIRPTVSEMLAELPSHPAEDATPYAPL
jgi:hypothetical protein